MGGELRSRGRLTFSDTGCLSLYAASCFSEVVAGVLEKTDSRSRAEFLSKFAAVEVNGVLAGASPPWIAITLHSSQNKR